MNIKRIFKNRLLQVSLLVVTCIALMGYANYKWWISVQLKSSSGAQTKVYLKHLTSGVLDIASDDAAATIADVAITGIPVRELYKVPSSTTGDSLLAAEWVMNRDTSNNIVMFRYGDQDLVFRRAKIYGNFGADSLLIDFYKRGSSGVASAIVMTEGADVDADTLIATTDTTFTLTPTSTTTLDYSAGEGLAIRITPKDTLYDVSIAVEFDTYDVQ